MNWWQRLLGRGKMEEQLEKEMRFHLEQHAKELIANGVSPAEAQRRARMALGGPEQVKEECRDARGGWRIFGRTFVTRCGCCGSVRALPLWRF